MVTASDLATLAGGRPPSVPYTLSPSEAAAVQSEVEGAVKAGAAMVSLHRLSVLRGAGPSGLAARWAAVVDLVAALPVTGGGTWHGVARHGGHGYRVAVQTHPLRAGQPLPWEAELPALQAALEAAAAAGEWSMTISLAAGPSPGHYRIGSAAAHPAQVPNLLRGDSVREWNKAVSALLIGSGMEVRELGTPPDVPGAYSALREATTHLGGGFWAPMVVSW